MDPSVPPFGGPTAGSWIRASALGWWLGFVLLVPLLILPGAIGLGDLQSSLGLGMGAGVGFLQGRRLGEHRRSWTLRTAFGLALPFAVVDVAQRIDPTVPYSLAVCVLVGGIVVGLLQAPLVAPTRRARLLWVVTSTLAWGLAAATVPVADGLPRIPGLVGAARYLAVVLSGGILLGLVQAAVIGRLPRAAWGPA